jgi:hypothetical protein
VTAFEPERTETMATVPEVVAVRPEAAEAPVPRVSEFATPPSHIVEIEPDVFEDIPSPVGRLMAVIVTCGLGWALIVAVLIWILTLLLSH